MLQPVRGVASQSPVPAYTTMGLAVYTLGNSSSGGSALLGRKDDLPGRTAGSQAREREQKAFTYQ